MTAYTQPTQWTHALGNNADVSTLPDDTAGTTGLASLQKLFQLINQTPLAAGGVAPSREDFNALFKLLGESVFYMQNGGVWTYNNKYDYKVGRVVLHTDGNLYKCIKDNGVSSTVKAPTDTTYWTKLSTQIDVAAVDAKTATNKQDIAAIKSNYVTTNSQQNITALKIWETSSGTSIFFKDPRFERAKAPSADILNSVTFIDKNNANLGYMQICQRKDSNNALYIAANRDKNGQSDGIALGLILPRDTTKAGYATAPSTPSSATANEIATANFVNSKISAVTTGYVTTNTEQTITGKKTLSTNSKSNAIKLKITDVDSTVTPTENLWTDAIAVYDKNAKRMGTFTFIKTAEGNNQVGIQAINQNSNDYNISNYISVSVNNKGVVTTHAPTPLASSNDHNIATTSWVNDKVNPIKNNYVTTNTQQTISGDKSFTQKGEPFRIKDANLDVSKTPSQTVGNSIVTYDKNNKQVGYYQVLQESNGKNYNSIYAVNYKTDGTLVNVGLAVGIDKAGTTYTYAPTPSSSSNDNSIATTAWVKSKMLDFIYPVGSIYMSVNNVSPQTFLGGTWVALQDRFLIGAGHSYAVNATGGATTHTLTVNEMPSHTHTFQGTSIGNHTHTIYSTFHLDNYVGGGGSYMDFIRPMAGAQNTISSVAGASGVSGSIAASGGNQAHSIMNPYLAVYMWKRTA